MFEVEIVSAVLLSGPLAPTGSLPVSITHTTYYSVTAVVFVLQIFPRYLFWISLLDVYYERESSYPYPFSRYVHVHDHVITRRTYSMTP